MSMSDRELRKSTREASEKTKNRQEARQTSKNLKLQRSVYSELIATEEREISEAEATGIQSVSDSGESTEVNQEVGDSSSDEYLDPLRAVKSPYKPSSSESENVNQPGPTPSPSTWSTSVNQFFPEDCVRTPIAPPPSFSSSVGSNLLSPRLNLENIIEEPLEEDVFDTNINTEESEEVNVDGDNLEQVKNKDLEMDEETFNALLISLRREVF